MTKPTLPHLAALAFLFTAHCGGSETTARLEILSDPTWGLDELEVEVDGTTASFGLRRELVVVLPDTDDDQTIVVTGRVDGEAFARGSTTVTPIVGQEVSGVVELVPLSCGVTCQPGENRCSGRQVATCRLDEEGCPQWGELRDCPADAPFCSEGECRTECVDACSAGEFRCSGLRAVQECRRERSECLGWIDVELCDDPPENFCRDESTLVTYTAAGMCQPGGECEYDSSEMTCANGCDARTGGCRGELTPWAVDGYLKASNTDAEDGFAASIAVSADGSTLAIGALFEDSNARGVDGDEDDDSRTQSGAVYVFVRGATGWSQQAYLKASNADANDSFGYSLSLSEDGSTLAVGAFSEDSGANGVGGDEDDNSESGAGAVYIFSRTDETWSQQAYVKASNSEAGDAFGTSVSLSSDGRTLAVGAFLEDGGDTGVDGDQNDNSEASAGAVYVFTQDEEESWSQEGYLKASNTDGGDNFGFSVALSADGATLAVGAYLEDSRAMGVGGDEDDDTATNSGAVYVFARESGTWSEEAYVKASNTDAYDSFGFAVALSGDGSTLAVGAYNEDSRAVGIGGDETSDTSENSGAAYVFIRSATGWIQQNYIKASNRASGDQFGFSVALSALGTTLAIGARWEDSSAVGVGGDQADNGSRRSGAVYVFSRAGASWFQGAYVKATNTDELDEFGGRIALSGDGSWLAVGAFEEDSNATGVDGDEDSDGAEGAGAAYAYRLLE